MLGSFLGDLERAAAPAAAGGIRIGDLKAGAGKAVTVIYYGPLQKFSALRINQNKYSVPLESIVVDLGFIEFHSVLAPGATTFLYEET